MTKGPPKFIVIISRTNMTTISIITIIYIYQPFPSLLSLILSLQQRLDVTKVIFSEEWVITND